MKLSKDFLWSVLSDAVCVFGNRTLTDTDEAWGLLPQADVAVSIDSRTVACGEFFIALKGPSFDGHDFVCDALAKGACGALISKQNFERLQKKLGMVCKDKLLVVVNDTLAAFILLAKAWRARLTCPVVAITGSVGKTSTKEMVKSICKAAGCNVYISYKNYNNLYGICYNILCIPESITAVVMEVGINARGEMAVLTDILRPTIGLITNIGHAHLEGLGNSLQTVSYEKRQLFSFFSDKEIGIIFGDQGLLSDTYYRHPVARFGLKTKNQVQARKIKIECDDQGYSMTHFMIKWYHDRGVVRMHGNHQGVVLNALAASTIAYFLNISFQAVIDGLQTYQGIENRFQICKLKDGRGLLFNDCYNANPESMKAALLAFSGCNIQGRKIAVLGDMLELGTKEAFWHRQIGRVINKSTEIDKLILVGQRARMIGFTAPFDLPIEYASDWSEARAMLEQNLTEGNALVLVKASRGMQLGQMVAAVIE